MIILKQKMACDYSKIFMLLAVIYLVIKPSKGNMEAQCPAEYVYKVGSTDCFLFQKYERRTWYAAKEFCRREKATLAIVDTQDVADWLSVHIIESGLAGDSSNFWIDAVYNETLVQWIWDATGEPVDLGILPLDEESDGNQGTITLDSKLKGHPGSWEYHFICQRDVDEPMYCNIDEGWHYENGRCYLVSDSKSSWTSAVLYCQSLNGNLITLNSLAENLIVKDYCIIKNDNMWIGMNEVNHANQWYWVGDNSSAYTNWNSNESMPISLDGNGAAVVDKDDEDSRWMVESAMNNHHYMCEHSSTECVYGWEAFGDSCYFFNDLVTDKCTWDTANATCVQVGAQLAIIETQEEDDFIKSHLDENIHFWFGMYSDVEQKKFFWVDGTEYNRDNFTKMSDEDEQTALNKDIRTCNQIWVKNFGTAEETTAWVPLACDGEVHKYVCEVPKGQHVNMIIPEVDRYCPSFDGTTTWDLFSDYCYGVSQDEKTWGAAEDKCRTYTNGHLASLVSWSEQDFVRNLLATKGSNAWIGLNDRQTESEFVWSDENRVAITNWEEAPSYDHSQNCVEMQSENGVWDVLSCDEAHNFVCKAPYLDEPQITTLPTTVPPDSIACGRDWREDSNTGLCYRIMNEELTFGDARVRCAELGYNGEQSRPDLVSLSTLNQQMFVQTLLAQEAPEISSLFIGFSNSENDGFYWVGGDPVTYVNFADGEPNNIITENCGEIFNDGEYKWNDVDCDARRASICEKKGSNYVAPSPPIPKVECPDGWTFFNQHCYFFSTDLMNWIAANESCSGKFNSKLTSITSSDENQFLLNFILSLETDMWIGLYSQESGNNFTWIDQSPFTYENWIAGEPNNLDGNEPCVEMKSDKYGSDGVGGWNDVGCDSKEIPYTCKMQANGCPQGWYLREGKCYYISDNDQTWNISLEKCKEFDGYADLLSWHSQEEVNFVIDIMGDSIGALWIGLFQDTPNGTWQWTDGSDLDYPNWSPGQPQNNSEYCALTYSDGTVHDYPCTDSTYFSCEYFPSAYAGCQKGWKGYDDWCYYNSATQSSNQKLDFQTAKSTCVNMGGDLVSMHSAEQNNFVGSTIPEFDGGYFWIGLTDVVSSGAFTWTDLSSVIYTHMGGIDGGYSGSPICFTTSNAGEGNFMWYQYDCAEQLSFICKAPQTIVETTPSNTGCKNDEDLFYEGSCYRKVTTANDFMEGKDNCSKVVEGGHLVTIKNQLESAFLSAYFKDLGDRSWIGLERVDNGDGSVEFKWVDGSDVAFTNWGQFEPTTQSGSCVWSSGTTGTAGLWYITDCNNKYPFFCEYPREGYTTLEPPPHTTSAPAYCAPGWTINPATQSCYKLMQGTGKTQGLSEENCMLYGGHLVSINSEQEEQFIMGLDDFNTFEYTTFWTGLVLSETGGYEWLDGSPTDFLHWANGQPDSHLHRENCVSAYKETLALSDTYCDSFFAYMCKAPQGMDATTPPPLTPTPDKPCPGVLGETEGWVLFEEHCYRVYEAEEVGAVSWSRARDYCHQYGGELASVLSQEENSFILSKVYTISDWQLWIGGYSAYDSGYQWIDEQPFEFINWDIGEPNNQNDQESCIALYPQKQAYWNDNNCAKDFGFICKKHSGSTAPPPGTTPIPKGDCKSGWHKTGGRCMKIITDQFKNFEDARTECHGMGVKGELASIHGPEQQAVLAALVGDLEVEPYIGLQRTWTFSWVDQTTLDYTNWAHSQPDNSGEEESCVMLFQNGFWNDAPCDQNRTFTCMIDLDENLNTPAPLPHCKDPYTSYVNYSNNCYRTVNEARTWQEAENFCVSDNAHLVSILNIQENSFLYALGYEDGLSTMWTGFNSLDSPDVYEWSDGLPVLFANWDRDQPNVTDTDSRCVELSTGGGLWNSTRCDLQKHFVCKHLESSYPTPDPPIDGKCPSSTWLDFGGSYCYLVSDVQLLQWSDANTACLQEGANLVSVHSQSEMDLIKNAFSHISYNIWSGLIQQTNDYGWSDGTAYNYFNWAENEPNGEDENCVEMYRNTGLWNDLNCDAYRAYMCKIPKSGNTIGTVKPTSQAPPIITTPSPGSGLGGGAIAGIVIACMVLVTAVGLVGYAKKDALTAQVSKIKPTSEIKSRSSSTTVSVVDMDGNDNFGSSDTNA